MPGIGSAATQGVGPRIHTRTIDSVSSRTRRSHEAEMRCAFVAIEMNFGILHELSGACCNQHADSRDSGVRGRGSSLSRRRGSSPTAPQQFGMGTAPPLCPPTRFRRSIKYGAIATSIAAVNAGTTVPLQRESFELKRVSGNQLVALVRATHSQNTSVSLAGPTSASASIGCAHSRSARMPTCEQSLARMACG